MDYARRAGGAPLRAPLPYVGSGSPSTSVAPRHIPTAPTYRPSMPIVDPQRTYNPQRSAEALLRLRQGGVRGGAQPYASPRSLAPTPTPLTRPQDGTFTSPTRDSRLAGGQHLGGVARSGLPSTWVAGRQRLSGPSSPSSPALGLPTHTGGVRYGPNPAAGAYGPTSRVFAPTWGAHHHHSYAPSVTVIQNWGYGCVPCYQPAYPVYVAPTPYPEPWAVQPAPTWVPPTEYAAPSEPALPGWPEPGEPLAPGATESGPPALTAAQQQSLVTALEAFRREGYAESLATLESLVAESPEVGEAWLGVAHAAFALGRLDRAAQAVTRAALLGAFPRGYRFDPAPLYVGEQAFRVRLTALEQRVAAVPADADARLVLAWLLASLGERVRAQEEIRQVLLLRASDEAAPILALALLPAAPVQPAAR